MTRTAIPPHTPILSALDRLFAPRGTTGHIEAQILQDAARSIPGRNPAHMGNGRFLPTLRSDDLGRNEPQVAAASFGQEIDESFAAWTLAIGLCVTAAGLLGIIATLWWRV